MYRSAFRECKGVKRLTWVLGVGVLGTLANSVAWGQLETAVADPGDAGRPAERVEPLEVFVHTTTVDNTFGSRTLIDDPRINGNPNVRLTATAGEVAGNANGPIADAPPNVYFDGRQWVIFRRIFDAMPLGVSFNVEVAPGSAVAAGGVPNRPAYSFGSDCCTFSSSSQGCPDADCEDYVCWFEPSCCTSSWGAECVFEAAIWCYEGSNGWGHPTTGLGNLCGGGGCHFASITGPGCSSWDPSCEATVCAMDPYCCDTWWDDVCAARAAYYCPADSHAQNRYLSIESTNTSLTAIRVKQIDSATFPQFNGRILWQGTRASRQEGTSPTPTFWSAELYCTPHYAGPGLGVGLVHVTDHEVYPQTIYEIREIFWGADVNNEANYSAAIFLATTKWGDVVPPFSGGPSAQPDFIDISALVNKFKSLPGAPCKARAQLQPRKPNPAIAVGFADISQVVDAFKGAGDPYSGVSDCP